MAATQPSSNWPFVVNRREHLESDVGPIPSRPTLLSLDGGGMRGLISAQVLIQLEDSIKQVLWKAGLIHESTVKALLDHAVKRGKITAVQQEMFQNRYVPKSRQPARVDAYPAEARDLWAAYRTKQSDLLQPPADWDKIKQCFDIDIADYFDQLAGTSTGGLLALYLASKGVKMEEGAKRHKYNLKNRPGSGAGASDFYKDNGTTIFGTSGAGKIKNILWSGGDWQHDASGLEKVLDMVFGDMTLDALDQCGTNVLVTTVDDLACRSGFFFHRCTRAPFFSYSGLATPLRKGDRNKLVLVRDPVRIEADHTAAEDAEKLAVGQLAAKVNYGDQPLVGGGPPGSPPITSKDDLRFLTTTGGWVAPTHFEIYDFKLLDVARATSAAPAFLPPKMIKPVAKLVSVNGTQQAVRFTSDADMPEDWRKDGRKFVDGGLANNDPVYLGLAEMMQRNNKIGVRDVAILSIGTGTTTNAGNDERTWGQWFQQMAMMAANGISLGVLKVLSKLGGLVASTMNLNGEDKENILRVTMYGLLRVPEGTYMRIQLKDEADAEKSSPQPGGNGGDGLCDGLDSVYVMPDIKPEWRAALGKMDDPDAKVLKAYEEMGQALGEAYRLRLTWWVRCFIFGLEDAAKHPFVLELRHLDAAKQVQGGKFLEKIAAAGN